MKDHEAIQGRVLDLWLDDLQHDRSPRFLPDLLRLTNAEIIETNEIARFYKALLWPVELSPDRLDQLKAHALDAIAKARTEAPQ